MFGLDPVSALPYDFSRDVLDIPVLTDEPLFYNIDVGRSLTDTVAFTESLYRVRDILDTIVLSDSIRQIAVLRDTLELIETLVAAKAIKLHDTIVLHETIVKHIEALRFPKDYIVFGENIKFSKTIHISLLECIALLENIYKTQTFDLADTLVITDEIIKGLSDTFGFAELLEHNAVLTKCGVLYLSDKGPSDSLIFSESLTIGIVKQASLSDSLVFYDTVIRLL